MRFVSDVNIESAEMGQEGEMNRRQRKRRKQQSFWCGELGSNCSRKMEAKKRTKACRQRCKAWFLERQVFLSCDQRGHRGKFRQRGAGNEQLTTKCTEEG